jgi:hypothetical protein
MAVRRTRICLRSSQLLQPRKERQHEDTVHRDTVTGFGHPAHCRRTLRIASEHEAHPGSDHHTAGDLRADQRHHGRYVRLVGFAHRSQITAGQGKAFEL